MIRDRDDLDNDPDVIRALIALAPDCHLGRSYPTQPFRVFGEKPGQRSGLTVDAELAGRMCNAGLLVATRAASPWPGKHDGYVLDYQLTRHGATRRMTHL